MRGAGLPDGPRDDEGRATARPSPRRPTASVEPYDDSPLPLGAGMVPRAETGPQRAWTGLYGYWMKAMVPATSGKLATPSLEIKTFKAGVKKLREVDKLTPEQIRTLITEFARQVRMDRIDVKGKAPWFVFMGRWQTLTNGNASSMGLAEKMADMDDDGSRWT